MKMQLLAAKTRILCFCVRVLWKIPPGNISSSNKSELFLHNTVGAKDTVGAVSGLEMVYNKDIDSMKQWFPWKRLQWSPALQEV